MALIRLFIADLFSADVVARTAHRYTSRFFVELARSDDGHMVMLKPKCDDVDLTSIEDQFRNDALDEQLRERIREETSELQVALVQAALRRAAPTRSEP